VGKNLDKLGTYENFKAPWESDTGSNAEIDADKLKKFLFNLERDKAKASDAAEEAAENVKTAEKALTDAQAEFAKGDQSGALAEAQSKLAKAETERDEAQGNLLRITVGIDKGLTPAQAKRLQGKTQEELEADADEILETFGVKPPAADEGDDEDEDEDEPTGRTTPRAKLNLVNPGDTNSGGGEIDYEKAASDIVGGNLF
jgi:hypothetical protein